MASISRVAGSMTGILLLNSMGLATSAPWAQPAPTPDCTFPSGDDGPGDDGHLRGPVYGALEAALDWAGAALECTGMLRPDQDGVRLFFRGQLPEGQLLAIVLGIEGPPADLAGAEWPVSVTLIEEGQGQFYSSAGQSRCWTQVDSVTTVHGGGERISGQLYCVGALPSLVDFKSITIGDLHYSGRIDHADD